MNLNPFHKHSWIYDWQVIPIIPKPNVQPPNFAFTYRLTRSIGWCRKCHKTIKVEDK